MVAAEDFLYFKRQGSFLVIDGWDQGPFVNECDYE